SGILTELGDREETLTGTPQGGIVTPPTQWAMSAMVTLRVGVVGVLGVVGGAFPDGDAVPDGDLVGSDEDVFDEQAQYASAFFDGGEFRLGVELGEETFEVRGEGEVGLVVGELGVQCLDLVAQVASLGAEFGHAG